MSNVTRREALTLLFGGISAVLLKPVDGFAATKHRGKTGVVPKAKGSSYIVVSCLAKDGWHLGGGKKATAVAYGTFQRKVWQKWVKKGAKYSNGICVLDGRYLVATTPTFGRIGSKVDFYCGEDESCVIKCIIMDHKNPADSGCNKWGHDKGRNVLEFEVNPKTYRSKGCNPGCPWWMPKWSGKRVVSYTRGSSII